MQLVPPGVPRRGMAYPGGVFQLQIRHANVSRHVPRMPAKGETRHPIKDEFVMKKFPLFIIGLMALCLARVEAAETDPSPVRLAIYGLVHDHVKGFLPNVLKCKDVQLVGIVEPNHDLALRIAASFHLDTNLFHATLEELLAHTNVDAVATFTSTYDHRRVVEECAPHGLTVMMEKPLAVNLKDGRAI